MKQIPSPPFWGGVRVKKWSPFFDSGARSPIFGHLKMGTKLKKSRFAEHPNEQDIIQFATVCPIEVGTLKKEAQSACLQCMS